MPEDIQAISTSIIHCTHEEMNFLISGAVARRAFVMQRAEVIEALERLQVTVPPVAHMHKKVVLTPVNAGCFEVW
jgi:hypothetical protein